MLTKLNKAEHFGSTHKHGMYNSPMCVKDIYGKHWTWILGMGKL